MILYHGTCDTFVPDIKREGLTPTKHPMQLENAGLCELLLKNKHDEKSALYLTASLDTARQFADFRARYERTPYDHIVTFGPTGGNTKRKLSHAVHPTAKPVIVSVNVPDTWKPYIHADPQIPSEAKAYWTSKAIPPQFIKRITTSRLDYHGKVWYE
jgi:hypothetical protein